MSRMAYILGNLINVDTLSAVSTEAENFEKKYMYDQNQAHPWRMTAKTSQHATFHFGTERPDTICLLNHNFHPSVGLILKGDNDPPNWGAPDWSDSIIYKKHNIYKKIPVNYPWLRLCIEDGSNNENPETGEIIAGRRQSFVRCFSWPYDEDHRYLVDDVVTTWGQRWRKKKAEGQDFKLLFNLVKDDALKAEVEEFFSAIDGENPFVFIPDLTEDECWYGFILDPSLKATRKFPNNNSFPLDFEEQTWGLKLL